MNTTNSTSTTSMTHTETTSTGLLPSSPLNLHVPSSPSSLLPLTGPQNGLGSGMLGGDPNDPTNAAAAAASVQSYFQQEVTTDAVSSSFSRELRELQRSVNEMDAAAVAVAAAAAVGTASDPMVPSHHAHHSHPHHHSSPHHKGTASKGSSYHTSMSNSKKRKAGSNASIDLQTKIRLIELAEQYQYDPRTSGNGSGTGGGKKDSQQQQQQMSGIRLAAQFGLNKSTVSRILKRKEEFKRAYYKENISGSSKHINKKSKFEKLNRLVENWFDVTREKKVAVSDTLIRDVGKRFAEELGIEDFRGSNGWVRSLRNRKEHHQARNMTTEAIEREKLRKDTEAIERVRGFFPNGLKDLASFYKDLAIYLEKGGIYMGSTSSKTSVELLGEEEEEEEEDAEGKGGDGNGTEEFLKKKMIDTLRTWSHELMESELTKLKKQLKSNGITSTINHSSSTMTTTSSSTIVVHVPEDTSTASTTAILL